VRWPNEVIDVKPHNSVEDETLTKEETGIYYESTDSSVGRFFLEEIKQEAILSHVLRPNVVRGYKSGLGDDAAP